MHVEQSDTAHVRMYEAAANGNPDAGLISNFYLIAADMHLKRAMQLADTEWKVSLAFWAAMLAGGVSFISFTNASTLPMTEYIAHSDYLFLIPYLFAALVFVYGFSINQAESLVRERSRYWYCQNQASAVLGAQYRINSGADKRQIDPEHPIDIPGENKVWAVKLLSTFSFVTGVWAAAQWLAHGKIDSEKGQIARSARAAADDAHWQAARAMLRGSADAGLLQRHADALDHIYRSSPYHAQPLRCAFLECSTAPGWLPEIGTILWLGAAIFVARVFLRAYRGHR